MLRWKSRVPLSIPKLFAAATASTVRLAEVFPSCSLIAFKSCRVLSSTSTSKYSTPQRATLCGRLRAAGGRRGISITKTEAHRRFLHHQGRRQYLREDDINQLPNNLRSA